MQQKGFPATRGVSCRAREVPPIEENACGVEGKLPPNADSTSCNKRINGCSEYTSYEPKTQGFFQIHANSTRNTDKSQAFFFSIHANSTRRAPEQRPFVFG